MTMQRTQKAIEDERQEVKGQFEAIIKEGIQAKHFYKTERRRLRRRLLKLSEELHIKYVSKKQEQKLEIESQEKIKVILNELSQQTGYSYVLLERKKDDK